MLTVEWGAGDMVTDCHAQWQPCEQVKLLFARRDRLNSDVNVPSFSECDGMSEDLLAGLCWTFGND